MTAPWPWPRQDSGSVDLWDLRHHILAATGRRPGLGASREELLGLLRDAGVKVPPLSARYKAVKNLALGQPWTRPLTSADRRRLEAAVREAGRRRDRAEIARWAAAARVEAETELISGLEQLLLGGAGHVYREMDFTARWRRDAPAPTCRVCTHFASSVTGRDNPCPGDRHQCPVILAEQVSDVNYRGYHADGWICGEPGQMNDTFTAWTCGAGHVITRAGHVVQYRQHKCWPRCPWEDLSPETGLDGSLEAVRETR